MINLPFKRYWTIYLYTLAAYLAFNIIYLSFEKSFPKNIKMVSTIGCMAFLTIASCWAVWDARRKWWTVFKIWPLSIVFWMFLVDSIIGLGFHGNIAYLSPDTWPDQEILRIVNNGESYLVYKSILLVITGGLTYRIRY